MDSPDECISVRARVFADSVDSPLFVDGKEREVTLWKASFLGVCLYGLAVCRLAYPGTPEPSPRLLGFERGMAFSEISGVRRFVFSDRDGYVLLSLETALVKPDVRNVGFLEMPKHGIVLEAPILRFQRFAVSGRDWAKTLRVLRELTWVDINGPLTLKLPDERSWKLAGELRRHPGGVLARRYREADDPDRDPVLIGFDPKAGKLLFRELHHHYRTP